MCTTARGRPLILKCRLPQKQTTSLRGLPLYLIAECLKLLVPWFRELLPAHRMPKGGSLPRSAPLLPWCLPRTGCWKAEKPRATPRASSQVWRFIREFWHCLSVCQEPNISARFMCTYQYAFLAANLCTTLCIPPACIHTCFSDPLEELALGFPKFSRPAHA